MRIYDNGGRSFDRYTVVFWDGECLEHPPCTFASGPLREEITA